VLRWPSRGIAREPDFGLTVIVSVDADRDVADQPPGGLDGDLEPGAGLREPHLPQAASAGASRPAPRPRK